MANLSKTTSDHEEIRKWAEERGGKPSHVANTGSKDDIGILRIDFPGYSGEGSLEEITWDQFFEKFDDQGLSLIYQEETAEGERSNFNKLVSAETAAESEEGTHKLSGRPAKKKSGANKKSASRGASPTPAKRPASTKKAVSTGGPSTSRKSSGSQKASSKKASSKKVSAPARKTTAAKKTALTKKTALKKSAPSKKIAIKKAPSKKAVAKKIPAKKTAAKKGAARKRR